MTDYRISDLDEATAAASTDLLELSQDQGGSYLSKKVTFASLAASMTAPLVLYGTGSPPVGDWPEGTIFIKTYV